MSTKEPPTLRDRKRLETRARLETAAAELALRDGLELATIDAISERAGVSARTFFNYFESKEDAVLGIREIQVTEESYAEHAKRYDGADAIESVVGLLFTIMGPSIADATGHQTRMTVIQRFPQLLGRQLAQMATMTETMTDAVATLLSRGNGAVVDDATAEMMLGMCFSAVRIAIKEWVADGTQGSPHELEQRTIVLIRQLHERIR